MVRSKRSRAALKSHQATGTSTTLSRKRPVKKTYLNPARSINTTVTIVTRSGPAPTTGSHRSNGNGIVSDTESEHHESESSEVINEEQETDDTPETEQHMSETHNSISDSEFKLDEGNSKSQSQEVMDAEEVQQTTPNTEQHTNKTGASVTDTKCEFGGRHFESQSLDVINEAEQDTEELLQNTPDIDQHSQINSSVPPSPTSSARFSRQSQETFILNPSTSDDDLDPLPTITPMPSMFCDMEPTLSQNTSLQLHRNLTLLIAKRRLIAFQDEERMRQLDADIAKLKVEIQIMKSTFQRLRQKVLHTRRALVASGECSGVHPKPKLKTWRTV
ncbi:uncharacterized protein [Haliotis asinina]|uniref:uncharacterized protein n=1 Tax=Haliotis asinina TaxID=109174 RepID=UPI003531D421